MARRKSSLWPAVFGYVVGSFFGLAHVTSLVSGKKQQ